MTSAALAAIDDASEVVAEDHWAKKGDVDLYMHRKYKADSPTPVIRSHRSAVSPIEYPFPQIC